MPAADLQSMSGSGRDVPIREWSLRRGNAPMGGVERGVTVRRGKMAGMGLDDLAPFAIFDAEAEQLDRYFTGLDDAVWLRESRCAGWTGRGGRARRAGRGGGGRAGRGGARGR